MPNTQNCQNCCTTPETVNVPGIAGADGADGADGTNGTNAYTVTAADITIPAVGGTVNVTCVNSTWMVVNQKIFIGGNILDALGGSVIGSGGAYFDMTAQLGSNVAQLTFLGYEDDVAPGTVLASGSGVSPGGTQPDAVTSSSLSVYGNTTDRDSAYRFRDVEATAEVSIDGTSIALTLNEAGTWMISARVRVDYSEATFATDNKPLNLKLRRTNNTAADIGDSGIIDKLRDVTQAYWTAGVINLPVLFYATTAATDRIALFGWLDTLPDNDTTNGWIVAYEADISAVRISD